VTPAHQYRYDMQVAKALLVPFAFWDECIALSRGVTLAELKEAFMPVPQTPEEAFANAYRESIEAIEAYAQRLQESVSRVSNAERVQIYEQLSKLHQYAHQWEQAGQLLTQMMAVNAPMQPPVATAIVPQPQRTTSGEAVEFGLYDTWRYRRPVAFVHLQQRYEVKQWIKMYTIILAKAIREHGDTFVAELNRRALNTNVPRRCRLSSSSGDFYRAFNIDGWYGESDLSSDMISDNIKLIYHALGIPLDSFRVWVLDE
jgi:hypothetical protein